MDGVSSQITVCKARKTAGAPETSDRALSRVYSDLRRIAEYQLRGERVGHSFQPTDLVHEAFVKLVDYPELWQENRRHVLGIAARTMRQVLIDQSRRSGAEKRGGGRHRVSLVQAEPRSLAPLTLDALVLDEALERLGEVLPRCLRVLELHSFAGLTLPEVAERIGCGLRTAERNWHHALTWLSRELDPS